MTMWLFDGERRAESMTASASGSRCTTQASNFSLVRRSGTPVVMKTVSIPNCRKHSARSAPVGSLMLTRATRAVCFLPGRIGASAIPEAFCMLLGTTITSHILHFGRNFGKEEEGQYLAQRSYYPE